MAPLGSPRFGRADTLWSTSRARPSANILRASPHARLYSRYLLELQTMQPIPPTRRMKFCAHSQADSQKQPSHISFHIPYTRAQRVVRPVHLIWATLLWVSYQTSDAPTSTRNQANLLITPNVVASSKWGGSYNYGSIFHGHLFLTFPKWTVDTLYTTSCL